MQQYVAMDEPYLVRTPSTISTLTEFSDSDFHDMDIDSNDEDEEFFDANEMSFAAVEGPKRSNDIRDSLETGSPSSSTDIDGAQVISASFGNVHIAKKKYQAGSNASVQGQRQEDIGQDAGLSPSSEDTVDDRSGHITNEKCIISGLESQVHELQTKNRKLQNEKWNLENRVTSLKAVILTNNERVAHMKTLETQLDHALRYIAALKKQVRAQGGLVLEDLWGDERGKGDNENGEEDDDDDGDKCVPVYFPHAAANPNQYTALDCQKRRAMKH
ncbi:uncharacterized protein SPSK_07880 [Sporothrix schenckii 1099-18]|uniref:Uncharacterized protein n=1 Tax=Sporothrix schenckii 1099-18 TaxID=1397361 RepID=A0A0F2MHS9_SPOSC|nr:uncharacterized protein SPSK_07880 [Sporothrix schenckii 1099-18]KJR87726.1 hypothetical protein SPSK_07880 [Sporothrix schenckii 1099-18]